MVAYKNPGRTGKNFRPNPARTIEVNGLLKRDLAQKILAQTKALGKKSSQPIILHLSSGGGAVKAFYDLEPIFDNEHRGKTHCSIITIAREARSAAAYLLVAGDVACAIKGAQLVFHGVRIHPGRKTRSLWRENTFALALRLDRENRKIAKRLARKTVWRIAELHSRVKILSQNRGASAQTPEQFMEGLVAGMGAQLSNDKAKGVLYESHERVKLILALAKYFPTHDPPRNRRGLAAYEADVFAATIAYEIGTHPAPEWTIDPVVAVEIMMDYLLARDFIRGRHRALVRELALAYGRNFLSAKSLAEYGKIRRTHPRRAEAYLLKLAGPCAASLWYFALTLCHRLLSGETHLSAIEAYWLGLIDQVLERSVVGLQPGQATNSR